MNFLILFSGFAAVMLSLSSAFLDYLALRENTEPEYTSILMFLGLLSILIFFGSLLFLMRSGFGLEIFMGFETRSGVSLTFLLSILTLNSIIWQMKRIVS